ncbi:MAG: squalene-hopene/tetraprenyl-beta-curcumene cyclase, partial [Porticoccaceae bacterium]
MSTKTPSASTPFEGESEFALVNEPGGRFTVSRHSVLLIVGFVAVLAVASVRGADELPNQYEAGDIKVVAARADEPVINLSVEKASQHLDHGAVAWSKQKKCVSCHTNGTYLFIRPALTATLGAPLEETRTFFVDQLEALSKLGARKMRRSGTRPAQVIYIAAGLAEWDAHVSKKLSPETDKALRLTFELQNKEGTWHSLTCWPPFESSAYQEA